MSPTLLPDVRPLWSADAVPCPVSEEQTHALLDGELTPGDATALREHLLRCPPCRARVERLERFLVAVRRQRRRPSGLSDTLRRRLREIAQADGDTGAGGDA
ncbi:MAG: anti-sigma factor family protein [Gemmatirosa sp.]